MITYEEFLKEHGIDQLETLHFSDITESPLQAIISDDPREYINVARDAKYLRSIRVTETQSEEYYRAFTDFVKSCHDDVTISNGDIGKATKEEFLQGEEIINQIVSEIDTTWNVKQKLAYVHYRIADLISYVPNWKLSGGPIEKNVRNIWKSLVDELSVCNGITIIMRNILSRVGVKTQALHSKNHTFMLTEAEDGDILTDTTWDLTNSLYKSVPGYFGITYEQLRKDDIDDKGIDHYSHSLESLPENVIEISEEEREIYHSIGFTTEDRQFLCPISYKFDEINAQQFNNMQEKLDVFFTMFTQYFSREATHLSETRKMLENCIIDLGIDPENLNTRFVYSKDDENSIKPYLALHIDTEQTRNQMRFLNLEAMQFENIVLAEFDRNYRLHCLDTTTPFWKGYLQEVKMATPSVKSLETPE